VGLGARNTYKTWASATANANNQPIPYGCHLHVRSIRGREAVALPRAQKELDRLQQRAEECVQEHGSVR
jgi:hypothetical protein